MSLPAGEFSSITVKNEECESQVVISPEGIWVSSKDGKVAASVQMQRSSPVLSVMDHRRPIPGHQIALHLDKDGGPCLQIVSKEGKLHNFGYEEIVNALAPKS